jgi:hypothetical protein
MVQPPALYGTATYGASLYGVNLTSISSDAEILSGAVQYSVSISSNSHILSVLSRTILANSNIQVTRYSGNFTPDSNLKLWQTYDSSSDLLIHNSTVFDASGNNNIGSLSTSDGTLCKSVPGVLGQGIKFDGTNDYITVPYSASLNNNDDLTISFWYNAYSGSPVGAGSYRYIGMRTTSTWGGSATTNFFIIHESDNRISWNLCPYDAPTNAEYYRTFSSGDTMGSGVWNHFLLNYSSTSGSQEIYKNGVRIAQSLRTPKPLSPVPTGLYIGGNGGGTQNTQSYMDDFRIYNRFLGSREALDMYLAGQYALKADSHILAERSTYGVEQNPGTLGSGLVGYYTFNNTFIDSSGNSNHGTLTGGTSVYYTPGRVDIAGSFVGSAYLLLGNNSSLQVNKNLTLAMWIRPTGSTFAQRRNPIWKSYGAEYTITQNTDRQLVFYHGILGSDGGTDGVQYKSHNSSATLTLNQWDHVAVVRDFDIGSIYWYFNGNLSNKQKLTYTGSVATSSVQARIGQSYTGWNYEGDLDDVRIYNRALSGIELIQLATPSLTADAIITKPISSSIISDSFITKPINSNILSDANIVTSFSRIILADAMISKNITGTIVSNSHISKLFSQNILSNTVILKSLSVSITSDSVILKSLSNSIVSDANISKSFSSTITADANITFGGVVAIVSNATISKTITSSVFANTNVLRTRASGDSSIDTSLVGWWKLDSMTAGSITPASVGFNGSVIGSVTFVPSKNNYGTRTYAGSTASYVKVPQSPIGSSNNTWTVAMWVYQAGSNPHGDAQAYINAVGRYAAWVKNYSVGSFTPNANYNISGVGDRGFNMTANQPMGSWYHIAFTYDYLTGTGSGFFNGTHTSGRSDLAPAGSRLSQSGNQEMYIGGHPDYPQWNYLGANAIIDDVRIYDRVLSTSEMYDIYAAGATALNSDTWISKTFSNPILSDAHIKTSSNSSIVSDAHITEVVSYSGNIVSNANISTTSSRNITSNSHILSVTSRNINSDSTITKNITSTILSDSIISKSFTNSITSNSHIKVVSSQSVISNSYITKNLSATIISNTIISKSFSTTILSNSVILSSISQSITSDSSIFKSLDSSILSDSYITNPFIKALDKPLIVNAEITQPLPFIKRFVPYILLKKDRPLVNINSEKPIIKLNKDDKPKQYIR